MGSARKVLELQPGDQEVLAGSLRSRTLPRRLLERVQIVLAAAEGLSRLRISERVGVARDTAILWRRRYEAEGLAGIERFLGRPGRPRRITREVEERVIEETVTSDSRFLVRLDSRNGSEVT